MRKLAWAWVILVGLTLAFLTVLAPFAVRSWWEFEQLCKAWGAGGVLLTPALRYLRKKDQEISGPDSRKPDAVE